MSRLAIIFMTSCSEHSRFSGQSLGSSLVVLGQRGGRTVLKQLWKNLFKTSAFCWPEVRTFPLCLITGIDDEFLPFRTLTIFQNCLGFAGLMFCTKVLFPSRSRDTTLFRNCLYFSLYTGFCWDFLQKLFLMFNMTINPWELPPLGQGAAWYTLFHD